MEGEGCQRNLGLIRDLEEGIQLNLSAVRAIGKAGGRTMRGGKLQIWKTALYYTKEFRLYDPGKGISALSVGEQTKH